MSLVLNPRDLSFQLRNSFWTRNFYGLEQIVESINRLTYVEENMS